MLVETSNQPKAYFISNACEEGRLDSARLKVFSEKAGYATTDKVEDADAIFFYPCGHLNQNDTEATEIIKKINQRRKPSAQLIVWGCLPKINPNAIREVYNGPIVGPEDWDFFTNLFGQPKERIQEFFANVPLSRGKTLSLIGRANIFRFEKLYGYVGKTWYIKIVRGCNKRCTYCSDRLAYKFAKSIPMDIILKQFKGGLSSNCRHFYFVGRDLGCYGYDIGVTLADLLNKISETFPDQTYRISLFNLSPDALIALYPKLSQSVLSKRIFQIGSHIQSGSPKVLKLMGKGFSFEDWKRTILQIDKKYPNIRLATSIMVGFPGETDEDFTQTENLLREIKFDRIDLYIYDERPNLPSLQQEGRLLETIKNARWIKAKKLVKKNLLKRRLKKIKILY